jgi:hypothetical protein
MSERKPIGITVPYREVGYKEPTLREMERKLYQIEMLIKKIQKRLDEYEQKKV